MKRPVGLVLSSIALSLTALLLLMMTALTTLAGIFITHKPSNPPIPHLAQIFILVFSVVNAALAVWAILTVIGILRLQMWARYSILIIGGGLTAIGALMAVGTAISRTMFASMQPRGSTLDPNHMAVFFAIMVVFYVFIAAIGAWWLIYFNLSSTRELFLKSSDPTSSGEPHRPVAITILGWLFLLSAASCIVMAFLPLPTFIFGLILPPKFGHIVYLAFAIVMSLLSYGLFSLKESARLATIVFQLFGVCNALISLLPWSQERFRLYMAQMVTAFPGYPSQSPALIPYNRMMISSGAIFCLIFYAIILWLLHRHRASFRTQPSSTEPVAA